LRSTRRRADGVVARYANRESAAARSVSARRQRVVAMEVRAFARVTGRKDPGVRHAEGVKVCRQVSVWCEGGIKAEKAQ